MLSISGLKLFFIIIAVAIVSAVSTYAFMFFLRYRQEVKNIKDMSANDIFDSIKNLNTNRLKDPDFSMMRENFDQIMKGKNRKSENKNKEDSGK